MVVDKSQAISIARGQNNIRYFRPLTHDLADDILKNYGIKILMVKITELKNNTYFARLILRQGNKVLSLDSRPSDAL
ncbi:MAG TPA: bifunctional nuclease family protein, partial [Candidatus Aenigmarchaeota archaeon]|nr:bifunctional nuclease family protein [Candidatus Aenigmarchaeota archaeon]